MKLGETDQASLIRQQSDFWWNGIIDEVRSYIQIFQIGQIRN